MKINRKIILSIISVLIIGIIVTGATFAYWNWVVDPENETDLDFIVIGEGVQNEIFATLEGTGITEVTNLHPSGCNDKTAILKKVDINYLNKLKQSATITANLKVSEFNIKDYVPTSEQLKHLKYALTYTSESCDSNVIKNANGQTLTGDFSKLQFDNGKVTNLPTNLFEQIITAPGNMTGIQSVTYYLWIWLDSEYVHINVGDNNTDPT